MSHSAEKCKTGDPLGFINIYSVVKYQKTQKGDSFEALKNFRKVAQCRKIDPLVSSGFVCYIKKVKNERGTILHYFPLTGLGLMVVVLVVSIVRKVVQSE